MVRVSRAAALAAAIGIAACGRGGTGTRPGAETPALVATAPEGAGANCAAGGTAVRSGLDANGNAALDAAEVGAVAYVCNRADAVSVTRCGGNGLGNQPPALVSVAPEPAGAHCAGGGVAVSAGADCNRSGVLDAGEVESVSYACNGAVGPQGATGLSALLAFAPEPPGPRCAAGGTAASTGLDANRDGTLDASEVTQTVYVCNGVDGAPGTNAYATGPGVLLRIVSADVDADGTASATFRITDGRGVPLDREGLATVGAVDVRFVLAALDGGGSGQYVAYTTRLRTSPGGVSAAQPDVDRGGAFRALGDGTYRYAFAAKAVGARRDRDHRVAASATRLLDGARFVANAWYDFVPSGAAAGPPRAVVTQAACEGCHGTLRAHDGAWREVQLCATCHAAPALDPDSGNALDLRVLAHKLHRGGALPSVVAGTPYRLVAADGTTHDYSTVVYPRDVRDCASCHAGAQGEAWKASPGRAACGACHDTTSFEPVPPPGATAHPGGPQADDASCAGCHPPGDVVAAHLSQLTDPATHVLGLRILAFAQGAPDGHPEIDFQVLLDGQPRDIVSAPLTRLSLLAAAPTTDYGPTRQVTLQGTGATGSITAVDAAAGIFHYVPGAALALPATGSFALALEGYATPPGQTVRSLPEPSRVWYGSADGSAVAPRRAVVDDAACDACHGATLAHGGVRRGVQYCVTCHNPTATDEARAPRFEGQTVTAPSVDFKVMIHKIHRGVALAQGYVVGGFPSPSVVNPLGTPIDFGLVRYPGDLRSCTACHLPGTYDLPLPTTAASREVLLGCDEPAPSDPNAYCETRTVLATTLVPPTAAACTSCHDAPYSVAHAQVMTSPAGVESCATCHAAGKAYGVDVVHAPPP
jgi:OmcA/MtrC family decaheme c-type cytochrome